MSDVNRDVEISVQPAQWIRHERSTIDDQRWDWPIRADDPPGRHTVWRDSVTENEVLLLEANHAADRKLLWRSPNGAVRDMSSFAWGLPDRTSVVDAVDEALNGTCGDDQTQHPPAAGPR